MRILYVITPSRLSGAEHMLLRIAGTQRTLGDTVRVFSKPVAAFRQAAVAAGVEMVTDRIGGKLNLAARRRIAAGIRAFAPDVVCTFHSTGTLWGCRAAAAEHVPCVAFMQAANTRWPYTMAPAAIGCAEYVRHHLIAGGMPPEHTYTVHNGIEAGTYLDDDDRPAIRRELGLGHGDIVVGTLAHFTPRKAHEDLLRAAELVVSANPAVRFLWAGEGPLECRLKRAVERSGLQQHIRFLGFRSDAPRLHRAFDIFALPSIVEGLPLSLLEASASARPCVATSVCGNPEIVEDGVTGLVVPPRSPTAIAGALNRLVRDPALRSSMGEAGRRRVMERFTLGEMVVRLQRVFAIEIARQSAP